MCNLFPFLIPLYQRVLCVYGTHAAYTSKSVHLTIFYLSSLILAATYQIEQKQVELMWFFSSSSYPTYLSSTFFSFGVLIHSHMNQKKNARWLFHFITNDSIIMSIWICTRLHMQLLLLREQNCNAKFALWTCYSLCTFVASWDFPREGDIHLEREKRNRIIMFGIWIFCSVACLVRCSSTIFWDDYSIAQSYVPTKWQRANSPHIRLSKRTSTIAIRCPFQSQNKLVLGASYPPYHVNMWTTRAIHRRPTSQR